MKFKFSDIDLCKLKPNYNELMKEKNHAKYWNFSGCWFCINWKRFR
jgi:hypothetical protein